VTTTFSPLTFGVAGRILLKFLSAGLTTKVIGLSHRVSQKSVTTNNISDLSEKGIVQEIEHNIEEKW